MRLLERAKDRPGLVSLGIPVLVAAHILSVRYLSCPDPLLGLAKSDKGVDIYVGLLGFAALFAGFAGVVIVFGMSPDSDGLRELRSLGGDRLAANWLAPVTASMVAAGTALSAAMLHALGHPRLGVWAFEAALLFAAHGALRMIWLLKQLVRIITNESKVMNTSKGLDALKSE